MDNEEIKQWLSLQPTNIKSAVKFSHIDEAGPMYHMSLDGEISKFIPFVPRRAANKENVSVPRVSVAPSIMGCFIGYMASWKDIAWPGDNVKNKKFKNGWYLYELPYEYCIKPNKKLLFDQENSNEHWLVTYSPATREYRPVIVAKMFYSELNIMPKAGSVPEYRTKLVIEVLSDRGILLGGDRTLGKGAWMVEGPLLEDHARWNDLKPYSIAPISAAHYALLKGYVASMLSLESLSPPAAFKW